MSITETILQNMHIAELIALCVVVAYGVLVGCSNMLVTISSTITSRETGQNPLGAILDVVWLGGILYFLMWFFG